MISSRYFVSSNIWAFRSVALVSTRQHFGSGPSYLDPWCCASTPIGLVSNLRKAVGGHRSPEVPDHANLGVRCLQYRDHRRLECRMFPGILAARLGCERAEPLPERILCGKDLGVDTRDGNLEQVLWRILAGSRLAPDDSLAAIERPVHPTVCGREPLVHRCLLLDQRLLVVLHLLEEVPRAEEGRERHLCVLDQLGGHLFLRWKIALLGRGFSRSVS